MPAVLLEAPDQSLKVLELTRPITTVGCSDENDIQIPDADLQPTHAQFVKDGSRIIVVGMLRDMVVNGRREKRCTLDDGDVIRIGRLRMTFYANSEQAPRTPTVPQSGRDTPPLEVVNAYRRIHEFSQRILSNASTSDLVETILDSVLDLTHADKGFLVLLESGRPVVRAARHIERREVQLSLDQLSDSILKRVMSTKTALVVSDALSDETWSASESVVNLKLTSVMCCPLLERDALKGLLYVGNHRVSRAFDEGSLELLEIFSAQASLLLSQAARIEELTATRDKLSKALETTRLGRIVGTCPSMQEVFRRVRKVATTDISVLITGETGTGKELIARELHENSKRRNGPFIVINCGAIPENLLESELFGHARGAFTGAERTRDGKFQAAHTGSLFLDEIGELSLSLQVKLLRALQERVVTKVGETTPEPVDIRVIAATNRDLEQEVKQGGFREDLFYRLNVVQVSLPPLRERGDDLEVLAKFFLARAVSNHGRSVRGFSKTCLLAMRKYAWPGNVRELENRIEKAVVLTESNLLTALDLDIQPEDLEEVLPLAEAKERFQARYIDMVLQRNGGNRTKTARELGVDPRTVFRHLEKRHGLYPPLPTEEGIPGLDWGPEDLDPAKP
ncbi:MAG: sigma 54-interacting transcriptional regulator [Myxococcota bacterium]